MTNTCFFKGPTTKGNRKTSGGEVKGKVIKEKRAFLEPFSNIPTAIKLEGVGVRP